MEATLAHSSVPFDRLHINRTMLARVQRWIGPMLSGIILAVVLWRVREGGMGVLSRSGELPITFWIVFAAYFLTPAMSEWLIYRRLWNLPFAGLTALLRKQVSNELVLGYSGDVHFYLWARQRLGMPNSPFGAVKDVAILSAVAGNIATLMLMASTAPLLLAAMPGTTGRVIDWSVALIAASPLAMFVLRRQLFSSTPGDLALILAAHAARITVCLVLLAMLLDLLIPGVSAASLLLLVTLRMMVSRLPLLPAKDVVFAGAATALLGTHAAVVPVIALVASIVVASQIAIWLALAGASLVSRGTFR